MYCVPTVDDIFTCKSHAFNTKHAHKKARTHPELSGHFLGQVGGRLARGGGDGNARSWVATDDHLRHLLRRNVRVRVGWLVICVRLEAVVG